MKLIFSKSLFFGRIYAFSSVFILLLLSGVFFFDLVTALPGSDHSNNLKALKGASSGSYWSGSNVPRSMSEYLTRLHYYYWLGVIGNFFQNDEVLLRGITLFLTFLFVYPSLISASHLRNKILLFAFLFVLFISPRFLDLVIGNIRSASALVFVYYAMRIKRTILKYLLMGVGVTFHLAVLAPILLHILYRFWRRLPHEFSRTIPTFLLPLLVPGILIISAKLFFPGRGAGDWEGGFLYTFSILILAIFTFFIGKRKADNEFVFISLGLISLVLWGSILGYSTMRYFSFFFPFFATMILLYDREPNYLVITFILWLLFAIASHASWG